jgi:CRP/FNR family transcriptional regulator, cyclic AMP receptor protein
MDWVNLLGYAAAASVLATFCMRTMIPIRILALVSNVLFCLYGYLGNLYPHSASRAVSGESLPV